jgi:hypothetical protein
MKGITPKYTKIKVPNTVPAAKFAQNKVQEQHIKDKIKYTFIKARYVYNII